MTKDARKMSKLKLIMGITIPVFVMIASLIMVGVSFAWFSDSVQAEIATLDLTAKRTFMLEFVAPNIEEGQLPPETELYHGETAINTDGYLVSKYRAVRYSKNEAYYRDKPYSFMTRIGLSTQGIPIDFNMSFKFIEMSYKPDPDNPYQYDRAVYGFESENVTPPDPVPLEFDISVAPYAFTWYFVPQGTILETTATTVYTPYGLMTLGFEEMNGGSFRVASTLNGNTVTQSTSIQGVTPAGITNFTASKNAQGKNQIYDFYVVFAPQELFWMQFFPADRDKTYATVYPNVNEVNIINEYITRGNNGQMYYSTSSYEGTTFEFIAQIDVSIIRWPQEQGE